MLHQQIPDLWAPSFWVPWWEIHDIECLHFSGSFWSQGWLCIEASLYEKFGDKISHFWWRRQNPQGQIGWWEPWCDICRMVCESDAEERLFQLLKKWVLFFLNSNIVLPMNLHFGQDTVWIALLCSSWYQGGLKSWCWITDVLLTHAQWMVLAVHWACWFLSIRHLKSPLSLGLSVSLTHDMLLAFSRISIC